jgi:hypothetical protein
MTSRSATILLVLASGLLPAAAQAAPSAYFRLATTEPCVPVQCVATVDYDTTDSQSAVLVEVDWNHPVGAAFAARTSVRCSPPATPDDAAPPCTATSPPYAQAGVFAVAVRITDSAGEQAVSEQEVEVLSALKEPSRGIDPPARPGKGGGLCGRVRAGEHCGPGNDRRTPGGDGKVSHKGWPAITGIFWQVTSTGRGAHARSGTPKNDELLGHHGSDTLYGGAGKDVLWGDYDPNDNNTSQRDVLRGGAGDDFIYPSHGTTRVEGGPGRDYVWAYYGGGVIDCGPGRDRARVRLHSGFKVRNCEIIGHFCSQGPDGHGGCLKPGEKRRPKST